MFSCWSPHKPDVSPRNCSLQSEKWTSVSPYLRPRTAVLVRREMHVQVLMTQRLHTTELHHSTRETEHVLSQRQADRPRVPRNTQRLQGVAAQVQIESKI